MAPIINTSKGLQNRSRPAAALPKAIVPALPLAYVKASQRKATGYEKPKETSLPLTSTPASIKEEAASSPITTTSSAAVNGSPNKKSGEEFVESLRSSSSAAPETSTLPELKEEKPEVTKVEAFGELSGQAEEKADDPQEEQHSAPSESQSTASRSTYQLPPPFYPASHSQSVMSSESVKLPSNVHNPVHNTHPSAGSIMFGGYPESNNSSPAPPLSAGNVPPYPFVQQAHHGSVRHGPHPSVGGHQQHISNGFSPMTPAFPPGFFPPQDGFGVPLTDGFARRQMMGFGPSEAYSPSATPQIPEFHRFSGFDPSTPISVHGSQSSAPNDQENGRPFYSQYPTAVISNGSNGHVDDVRLYQRSGSKPRAGSQAVPQSHQPYTHSPQTSMHMDSHDGLVSDIQNQFAETEYADSLLELRYSDDRATPVRINGHKLLFARSPVLKHLIKSQSQEASAQPQLILIKSNDRYLRSDAFWLAVQRLYGGPLLDVGAMANFGSAHYSGATPIPGTPADRFDLALGYTAAGTVLQIVPVIKRGIDIASQFITWGTVERALEFALEGGLDITWIRGNPQANDIPRTSFYGPAVNTMISNAVSFIITSFPPNFELDTTVTDPLFNSRLPHGSDGRPTPPNPRLSSIKFGDHPTEESLRAPATDPITTTLSRLLLNLPFYLLKYVLESPHLGNVSDWATSALRQKVMRTVIEEREKRRLRVRSNRQISNEERTKNDLQWNPVGWQEQVTPLDGNEELPTLTKTWVDFTIVENGTE